MAESCCSIVCSLQVETKVDNSNLRKFSLKNSKIDLGRNEFKEIILKVSSASYHTEHIMKNILIHRRFMKEGKATISLPEKKLNLLISNCPPNSLFLFLRTLATKVKISNQQNIHTSIKNRLMVEKRKAFHEISPINAKDLLIISGKSEPVKIQSSVVKCNIMDNINKKLTLKRTHDSNKENTETEPVSKSKKIHPVFSSTKLTVDQERVLACVMSGKNVFFTGKAGTGKSFLLKKIIGTLPPNKTYVTASTGVAASQIGGLTLHAFAGIGSGSASLDHCFELASRKSIVQQWKSCNHLIIDEISMVDGEFFSKLENIARKVRQNEKPFGGIQLILCGDFLQLPPVSRSENSRFCFQTSAWSRCMQLCIILDEVKRQTDQRFINILKEIRLGRCTTEIELILKNTCTNTVEKNGIIATRLCTHKDDVNHMNKVCFEKLSGEIKTYHATDSDSYLSSFIDKSCPVPQSLLLKKGTQLMLLKNWDISAGLVNGSRGVVTGFENNTGALPIVKFMNGSIRTIGFEKFLIKSSGNVNLLRKQLPIKHAWAISIHKSQGMTLDCVEMSLSKVFEYGQAYVALSRARSLSGLKVLDFDKTSVRADPKVLKFYSKLKLLHETRPVLQSIGNIHN